MLLAGTSIPDWLLSWSTFQSWPESTGSKLLLGPGVSACSLFPLEAEANEWLHWRIQDHRQGNKGPHSRGDGVNPMNCCCPSCLGARVAALLASSLQVAGWVDLGLTCPRCLLYLSTVLGCLSCFCENKDLERFTCCFSGWWLLRLLCKTRRKTMVAE